MADDFRRIPVAPEVDAFQAEIGGDEYVVSRRNPQYSAIIADSSDQLSAVRSRATRLSRASKLCDELSFRKRQASSSYAELPLAAK